MKWYKRTDPANPNRFYYSKNNRPEYTEEDIMHGAYGLRLGNDGRWNEIQNWEGMGYDNFKGKLIKLPEELHEDFIENSDCMKPTPEFRTIRRKRKLKWLGFKDAETFEAKDNKKLKIKNINHKGNDVEITIEIEEKGKKYIYSGVLKGEEGCIKCGDKVINIWEENGKLMPLCKECYLMHFYAESFDASSMNCELCGSLTSDLVYHDPKLEETQLGGDTPKMICNQCHNSIISYRADDGEEKIIINGYMPKRVEKFRQGVLFYIGDLADKRYSRERKLMPNSENPMSIADPQGINIADIERILNKKWNGQYILFDEGGTFVGKEENYFESETYEAHHRDIWSPEREVIEQIKYDSNLRDKFPLISHDSYWDSSKVNEWTPERQTIEQIRGNREYEEIFPFLGKHPGYYDANGHWVEKWEPKDYSQISEINIPLWTKIGITIGGVTGLSYLLSKMSK